MTAGGHSPTALVVTQHRSTLQRGAVALGAAGLEVRALDTLEALDEAPPAALVLLDLDLARSVGVSDLVARARATGSAAVLVVGAQDAPQRLMEALALPGVDHLVPKRGTAGNPPLGPDELAVFTAARRLVGRGGGDLGTYLTRGAPIHRLTLNASEQRARAIGRLSDYLAALHVAEQRRIALELAAEELLMNAIYDAPCDEAGAPRHAHLDRQRPVDLEPGEEVELTWGCDGHSFAMGVVDPFGALEKRHVMARLRLAAAGTLAPVAGSGGAGLGMAMVHRVVNQLVFTVTPHRRTEVIAIMRLAGSHKDNMEAGTAVHFHFEAAP